MKEGAIAEELRKKDCYCCKERAVYIKNLLTWIYMSTDVPNDLSVK